MKKLSILASFGVALALGPALTHAPTSTGAPGLVASLAILTVGIFSASAASSSISAIPAALGALAALSTAMLAPMHAAIAGAAFFTLAYGERASRVAALRSRIAHVALSSIGGAIAATIATSFASADVATRFVAVVVGIAIVSLPTLIDAVDPLAHALEDVAKDVPDPSRTHLIRAASLLSTPNQADLEPRIARDVAQTFRSLLRLAEARARLTRISPKAPSALAVATKLDARIVEHTEILERAYSAVSAMTAAELSLDDPSLRKIDDTSDALEAISKAIADEESLVAPTRS
jgi:hypothetical protein